MVDFPAFTELYLTEFRDLITLEDLKLDKLLELIFKDFDLEKMLGIEGEEKQLYSNEESLSVGSSNYWVNMSTYILLFIAILAVALVVVPLVMVFMNFLGCPSIG